MKMLIQHFIVLNYLINHITNKGQFDIMVL
jgi:hypothetical protein